ncbi:MAG TPA: LysE family transporter [Patescibacteria group bacterium]|nr:LysE family transporter [Patescibacteria group bacterium]
MFIFSRLLEIFVLGLIGGANPGPILAASFTEALRKGFVRSLKVIFMAMLAETIVAGFILFLFFSINIPSYVFYIISFVGAGVLIWLASKVWKIRELDGEGEIFSFKKIFLLTIFNGPFWVFWIAICVPQAFLLRQKIAFGQVRFLILFELGWLAGTVFLVYLFSRFRPFLLKTKFVPTLFKIFALILLFFAIKLIFGSIVFFIK